MVRREGVVVSDAAWRRRFRRALLAWYARAARGLPWRASRDPYRIWVSEVMLQQTQVATVVPYFERFLAAWPDVASLAAADEQQVLRLWEGLGYYRRARQLHQAAGELVRRYGGSFPRDPRDLQALPGIGRYTAGAILSIAFDQREPILEANSLRLLCRLLAHRADPARSESQRLLWSAARQLLPHSQVGTFNQALMELGSQVCRPRGPDCAACPLAVLCQARALGLVDTIPTPPRRPVYESVHEAAVVVFRRKQVLVGRRGPGERWAGLWDFPRFAHAARRGPSRHEELIAEVRRQTGVTIRPTHKLTTIRHGVTRFRITLDCQAAEHVSGRTRPAGRWRWVAPHALESLPLSATGRRISRLIQAPRGLTTRRRRVAGGRRPSRA